MFFALLPLPCLRGLKSLMSMTIAALHRLPAMTNLLLVGTWFSDGFFGDLHRRFLIKSPVLHHPPSRQKNALVHAPGAPTNKISSGDEIATPLASFQIGSIITGFPQGLRRVKFLRTVTPPLRTSSPTPPRDFEHPLECCE